MTKSVDTAFERHFSEPPIVAVKVDRTHCEACKEALDPNVMHKCHGNQEYQAPLVSSTEITEACPECGGSGVLFERHESQPKTYTVICGTCRTFLSPETTGAGVAISSWNVNATSGMKGVWPVWRARLPGDDERANVIPSEAKPSHPDLSGYKGVCPAVHVDGEVCDWCEGTGTIPPTKPEGAQ